jgi:hypothetical protein
VACAIEEAARRDDLSRAVGERWLYDQPGAGEAVP